MRSLFLAAALAAALPCLAETPAPRLVVFLAVDGLPMRQIEAWAPQFAPDGFRRFLDRGRTYAQARYLHGHTVTAAGHATMLSGAWPRQHGIISNEWIDPVTREGVYNTQDAEHRLLALDRHSPRAGTSPRQLLAETVGDVLRQRQPAAKVLAVAGKDRGAILPAGHRGAAYWFLSETGQFSSSSYYMAAHPAWVSRFNAKRPADAYWGARWEALLPEPAYAGYAPDAQPWMRNAGYGQALPAVMGAGQDAPGPRYYTDLLTSPFADALVLDFAREALRQEALGADAVPDLLSVSLSGHDYVSHAFGPESRLAQDHLLQLDRLLQRFFRDVDARVGKGNWLAVLTADHGFTDTPEWAQAQGRPAGRLPVASLLAQLNQGLAARFGVEGLASRLSASGLLFDTARMAGLDAAAVHREAARLLRGIEGLAAAYGPEDLDSEQPPRADQPHLAALRLAWHRERSAPVLFAPAAGWLYTSSRAGTSHGSPHAYDQHVPVLSWGPRWVGAGRVEEPVTVADIAPSLARYLRLPAPAQSQGRPLPTPATMPPRPSSEGKR